MPSFGHYHPSFVQLLIASCVYFFTRHRKCHCLASAVLTPASSLANMPNLANFTAGLPDEQRLFYTIMSGYEKAVRPSKSASEPVVVKLGLSLTQIMDIVSREKQD